jgi:exodeoxyribonuclease V alpha subunit
MADTIEATYHSSTWQGELDNAGLAWGIYLMYVDDKAVKCKGKIDPETMQPGLTLELIGKWVNDPKYGKQIAFETYTRKQPAGRYGVMAFLKQAPNIGDTTAEKIWDVYGENSIKMLIDQPEVVAFNVPGLRTKVAQDASPVLATLYGECKHKLPLINLFKGTKIPTRMADQVIRSGMADAVETISDNPFILMKFGGTGFKQCDTLRQKLRLDPKMPARIIAACTQAFRDRSDAVWLPADEVGKRMKDLLEFTVDGQRAIDRAVEFGLVVQAPDKGPWYALKTEADMELFVAEDLCRRMKKPGDWPMKQIRQIPDSRAGHLDKGLTDHQKEVVIQNMTNGGHIAILPGPPGTGKTTTLARILKAWEPEAVVCAPTGKATQRMEAALRDQGVTNIVSGTTHKILGARPTGDGFMFAMQNGEVCPEVLVVDETSMKSNEMAYRLLKGVSHNTHIIFLGDAMQLPPVGPGTMFRDLQALRRFSHLSEIHRNEGMIVQACMQISKGIVPTLHRTSKPCLDVRPKTNVHYCTAGKDQGKANYVDKIIGYALEGSILNRQGLPICSRNDLQFLTATHDNPLIGRHRLNAVVQDALNPNGGGKHSKYRVGDKVICLKNAQYKVVQHKDDDLRSSVQLSNGDLGTVLESNEKTIVVQMEHDPAALLIPVGSGNSSPFFDLGYCITTHKSQGSEWLYTVVVVGDDYGSRRLVDRTWLNTAISRAKHCAAVIASSGRIASAVKRDNASARKSFIHYHMKQYAQRTKADHTALAASR